MCRLLSRSWSRRLLPPRADGWEGVPGGRGESGQALKRFPYGDGEAAAYYLINKMPPDEFDRMLNLLVEYRAKQGTATS